MGSSTSFLLIADELIQLWGENTQMYGEPIAHTVLKTHTNVWRTQRTSSRFPPLCSSLPVSLATVTDFSNETTQPFVHRIYVGYFFSLILGLY